jgi:hypothetical protein
MTDSRFIVESTMMKVLLSSSALALVASQSSPARADLAPLSDDQVAVLKAVGDEPLDVEITLSYPRTNEWRLDTLFPELAGLGGGYVGVGADQNYTLAAAAKSEFLWMIDHDPNVRDIHLLYGALIPAAANADEFLAFFEKAGKEKAHELITAAISDEKRRKRILDKFDKNYQSKKHRTYFKNQRNRKSPEGKPATWLADPDLYAHVRQLFVARRVHTVAADLAGTKAMKQIADAATKLGTTVRIVYVSNAESFFELTDQARDNYKGLPHDDKSLLIRTVMMGLPKAKGSVWHYQTQVYVDYVEKLAMKREYPSFKQMVSDLKGEAGKPFIDDAGHSRITAELPRRKKK